MTIEFNLPDIGEGLHEAEIIEWLVAEGDMVGRNQPFVEILTDKSQTEMPAPAAGKVVRLGAAVGDIVQVGELLITIDDGESSVPGSGIPGSGVPGSGVKGGRMPRSAAAGSDSSSADADAGNTETANGNTETTDGDGASAFLAALDAPVSTPRNVLAPKAAPSTRRLALELGVDLTSVSGTGPGGRILAADVESAAQAPAGASPTPERGQSATAAASSLATTQPPQTTTLRLGQMSAGEHPLRGIRRATAKAMDLSWSTIPHVTAMDEVDASELMLARSRAKSTLGDAGETITPLALLMVAVARSLRAFPIMNATLDLPGETITVHDRINIAVAVASERGLMVPVVHDADQLGVADMAAEIARISAAARGNSVTNTDLADSTFTVSNYGSNGGYLAAPVIRPGETGIVGFGAITPRPIVVDDQVVARSTLPIVISADHRLVDGDVLSAFQAHLAAQVTTAIGLLLG